MATYHSQVEQDWLLDRFVFRGKRGGTFVDVGAYDGVSLSNTLMFERDRGWTGLCIEPNPLVFPRLREARAAICLNAGASDRDGKLPFLVVHGASEMLSGFLDGMDARHRERIERDNVRFSGSTSIVEVPSQRLDEILAEASITEIDFLSLDTEGSEAAILQTLRGWRGTIHVISVEANYASARQAVIDALDVAYLPPIAHRHDLFFIHRDSPYRRRLRMLRVAVFGLRVRRWISRRANSIRKRLHRGST